MRTKISFHRNKNKYIKKFAWLKVALVDCELDAYKFFLYIDQHPGNNCVLFIELFINRHVSAIKKK
jgi:hypothetical protein